MSEVFRNGVGSGGGGRTKVPTTNVCAVIVTYGPDQDNFSRLLSRLRPQVGAVIIVDNGSTAQSLAFLCSVSNSERVHVMELGANFGVAAGHNRGIEWARRHGFKYVVLFDQDSEPSPNMVKVLLAAHRRASLTMRIAAVGPRYTDRCRGFSSYFVRFGRLKFRRLYCTAPRQVIRADFLISSGALFALEAIEEIGSMDERLFIDHVDTEWFLRAHSKGFVALGVCDAEMKHALGSKTIRISWPLERHIPVHSPLRNYYMVRNSILLMKRSYAPMRWRINDAFRLCACFGFFLLFLPARLMRIRMLGRGMAHGMAGRSGPYS